MCLGKREPVLEEDIEEFPIEEEELYTVRELLEISIDLFLNNVDDFLAFAKTLWPGRHTIVYDPYPDDQLSRLDDSCRASILKYYDDDCMVWYRYSEYIYAPTLDHWYYGVQLRAELHNSELDYTLKMVEHDEFRYSPHYLKIENFIEAVIALEPLNRNDLENSNCRMVIHVVVV